MHLISADKRRNGNPIIIDTSEYGVTVTPAPDYKPPAGNPCEGCVFTFKTDVPSCMTGRYPDTDNCPYSKKNRRRGRNGS